MTQLSAADPTAAPPVLDLAANLILARLVVPTKRPPAPRDVRRGLERFLDSPLSTEQFQEWVEQLRTTGLLAPRGLRLTEAGRAQAMSFLGARELPPRCNWQTIQSRYLVPLALRLDPDSPETAKVREQENLAALLLKRRFNLPPGAGSGLSGVLEAVVCQKLNFPEETKLSGIKRAMLRRMLGNESLDEDKVRRLLPGVLLKATKPGVAGLRNIVLRDWATAATRERRGNHHAPPDEVHHAERDGHTPEFDLAAFAHTVLAVARDCPTGRFGDNKVFINHVWRRLADEGFTGMSLDTFKQKLLEANRTDLLTLSRADLVSVMNPEDVQESETPYLNAVFHFILIRKDQP